MTWRLEGRLSNSPDDGGEGLNALTGREKKSAILEG